MVVLSNNVPWWKQSVQLIDTTDSLLTSYTTCVHVMLDTGFHVVYSKIATFDCHRGMFTVNELGKYLPGLSAAILKWNVKFRKCR